MQDRSLLSIFSEALDCKDPVERARLLDETCGSDRDLRQRVEKLLDAHERAGEFLSHPSEPPPGDNVIGAGTSQEKSGDRIGRYRLLQQIGEGGCGVVYMAEQEEPVRRRVALKVIKLGMDTRQVVARFEAERQALALMDHPNIAKVFDAGSTGSPDSQLSTPNSQLPQGRPFFVMELVRGVKITEFCDQQKLSPHERLKLFVNVCSAIQHAHQKGIIHRDLKPSNILVTMIDGAPVPKVIDFGIAKATTNQRLTDKTLFTAFEQFIGTPAYMSPEQAEMSGVDIDTRTDIYSLGVILYELLTGRTPFNTQELLRSGIDEIRRTIREQEPPRPSTRLHALAQAEITTVAEARRTEPPKLIHLIKGDLDWVVMKCLEKDRSRRYETAGGLSADILRHLNNEPVHARPPDHLYQFQKFVRRNKLMFASSTAILLVLLAGITASAWQAVRATKAEREQTQLRFQSDAARLRAEEQEKKAETEAVRSAHVAQFMKDMLRGVGPGVARGRDTKLLREILDQTAQKVKSLKNQPEVQADLLTTLGNIYFDLGEYRSAASMHEAALELRQGFLSAEHLDVTESLSQLGHALAAQGKPEEAEALHRQALAVRMKLLGEEHLDVAASLHNLAGTFQGQRKWDDAEALHRKGLAIRRKLLASDHLDLAQSLNDLGATVYGGGNALEAIPLHHEALAIRRKKLGNEHPDVAAALDDLAWALSSRQKYIEAEACCRESVAIRQKWYGDAHPNISRSLQNLAFVLGEQGRVAEAEAVYGEALAMGKKVYGDVHPHVANTLLTLGSTFRRQGKLAQAEALYREAIDVRRKLFGNDNQNVGAALSYLALILHDQAKTLEAEAVCREALAIRSKLPANVYFPEFAIANLANVLGELGNVNEAEALYRERLENARTRLPLGDLQLARPLADLTEILLRGNKLLEAKPLSEECLATHEKNLPDRWETFNARTLLGETLVGLNQYAEAEPLLLSGYDGMKQREAKMPPPNKRRFKAIAAALVHLYEATHQPEKAAQWKQRAELSKTQSVKQDSAKTN